MTIIHGGSLAVVSLILVLWPSLLSQTNQRRFILLTGIISTGMCYMMVQRFTYQVNVFESSGHEVLIWMMEIIIFMFSFTIMTTSFNQRSEQASFLKKANSELETLALRDPLTNLPNRLFLENKLKQTILKMKQNKGEFTVMLMDLDGFKAVNDTWGHHIGDKLLIMVTKRMIDLVHSNYTLARLGGDEFVLVMEANKDECAMLSSELVKKISLPYNVHNYDLKLSLSIGIAHYPADGIDPNELILNADTAMYHTKNNGGNDFNFFQHFMKAEMQHKRRISEDLRLAIERNELCLFYQPKFSLPEGSIEGFEALLRWQHPSCGILAPAEFLPVAEKKGLIITIGYWVIGEACRQLRSWHLKGHKQWTVSVNLSALQFIQTDLRRKILEAIYQHQIPPALLILEISEATAMCDPLLSERIINDLCGLGVQVAIDGFGVSYRNLTQLYRLPASELKIERTLIYQILRGESSVKDVRALVSFAQSLNVRVVAIGVETSEQQQILSELGFTTLQGNLLGRPLPADEVLPLKSNHISDHLI